MTIGDRLKQARKSRGYTQDSLAEAIGVSRGVITNIEHGKAGPQKVVIHAICSVLKINQNWLMSGLGQMDHKSDLDKRARLLSYLYSSAKELSEEEQDYILDMIRIFQKHKDSLKK